MTLGVRSYGNTLTLQNVFNLEAIPDSDPIILDFAKKILNPRIKIPESDCATTLGRRLSTIGDTIGMIELGTEERITEERLNELITQGRTTVRVREASSCISEEGVCARCMAGTMIRRGIEVPDLSKSTRIVVTPRSAQNYVANTYSGSLLGYEPIDSDPLPGYSSLWDDITSHKEMDRVCSRLKDFKISVDELEYLYGIEDILERALTVIAFYGVYASVQV